MLVDVALPLPLFRTFTYAVEGRGEPLDPGMRVLVPFRNRKEIGIVVGAGSAREGITPKPIVAIPDDAPVLDPAMLSLCRWIAQYYIVPLGVAIRCALPAALSGADDPVPRETLLLHAVTGGGRTLVYIALLRTIVDQRNQSAIVLVPEIALTPQTVDRFRGAFGDRVAVLHSALSDGERYDAWLALRRGEKRIAVGARSAVFAPLRNLGAIIVDEEHEGSYKQGESPRYHAREVAIVRARAEGAVVVLGSATPSLESWVNAASGKYRLLTLPDRVGGGRLPSISVVDIREARSIKENGEPNDIF